MLLMPLRHEHRYNVVFPVQVCVIDQLAYLELHKMSGFGVLPALISAMLWAAPLAAARLRPYKPAGVLL